MKQLSKQDQERFWSKVDKRSPDECWVWQAGRHSEGYGGYKGEKAHRVAWELTNGPIPKGLHVLHECDNPPCCNPAHLFVGTDADNVRDAASKGRMARGEQIGTAKLTEAKVRQMRKLHDADGVPYAQLGRKFGVTRSAAHRAVIGATWKHVN